MKISVVIDVYNSQAYIVDAVESVLKQTYLPFELIIVDDGSTDETVVNIKNCIQNVPFARLIEKENGGQLSCLSRGILAAKGDLIALLDGDDMWKPNHLEEALEAFNKHADISLYFCNYECIGGEYNGAKKFVGGRIPSTFALTYLSEAFVGNVTSTLVAKADRLKPYLPFPLELEKDWVINADNPIVWLTSFSGRAKYSNKNCNIYYRVQQNGYSNIFGESFIFRLK